MEETLGIGGREMIARWNEWINRDGRPTTKLSGLVTVSSHVPGQPAREYLMMHGIFTSSVEVELNGGDNRYPCTHRAVENVRDCVGRGKTLRRGISIKSANA